MFNLENINLTKKYQTEREAIEDTRRYIFQMYIEMAYRLDDIDKRLKALEKENEQ